MLVMLCRGRTPVRPAHSAEFFGVFYFMSPAICGTRRGASPTEKQISYQQNYCIYCDVLTYCETFLRTRWSVFVTDFEFLSKAQAISE